MIHECNLLFDSSTSHRLSGAERNGSPEGRRANYAEPLVAHSQRACLRAALDLHSKSDVRGRLIVPLLA